MIIFKYKQEKKGNSFFIPSWVEHGGYFYNAEEDTFIGVNRNKDNIPDYIEYIEIKDIL